MAIVIKEIIVRTTVEKVRTREVLLTQEWKELLKRDILEQLRWNNIGNNSGKGKR